MNKKAPRQKIATAREVDAMRTPGRHSVGGGLILVVAPSGRRSWVARVRDTSGTRRDLGMGPYPEVTLAAATAAAEKLRQEVRTGQSPKTQRQRRHEQRATPTFEQAARQVHTERKGTWKNPKHQDQWISTLETYVFPKIGGLAIDKVGAPQVIEVLSPIWQEKAETARRVQQRIGSVIDWAFARDYRATQVSKKAVQIGLGSQTDRPKHFAALPYSAVPAFLDKIRGEAATNSRAALEFLILTAARSNEVRSATFAEVDLEAAEWRIPAERMKAKREHVVPLSPSAVAIVAARKENATGALIFPGNKATALSDVALTKALRVAGVSAEMGTVHGFRSGFRDWVSEETNFPGDVAEAALAHTISNKTEAAYRRGKLLAKRREMMLAWESFLNRRSAEVVPLRQAVS